MADVSPDPTPTPVRGDDSTHLAHIASRAEHAHEWLMADQRQQHGSDWLPLSVREHFTYDVPFLLAEIERLRVATQLVRDLAAEYEALPGHAVGNLALVAAHLRRALADLPDDGAVHIYLSTGCLHSEHDYCKGEAGLAGPKRPGECKFCRAACRCTCHKNGAASD